MKKSKEIAYFILSDLPYFNEVYPKGFLLPLSVNSLKKAKAFLSLIKYRSYIQNKVKKDIYKWWIRRKITIKETITKEFKA